MATPWEIVAWETVAWGTAPWETVALIRRFQILPDPDHLPKPVGRLTVRSSNGIRLRLLPRQSTASHT